jgi:hypothetical protein
MRSGAVLCSSRAIRGGATQGDGLASQALEHRSQPREVALGAGKPIGEDAQVSSLFTFTDVGNHVADLTSDPQALALEGERVRVAVGQGVLHLGDAVFGRAFPLLVDEPADSIEDRGDVVRHREPLSNGWRRDSMGRTAYL